MTTTAEQRSRWNTALATEARRELIQELARDERPRAFPGRPGDGYSYLVHRDTHPTNLGGWRVTYLQPLAPFPEYRGPPTLTPCGHVCAKDYADALREAHSLGADLARELPL